MCVLKHVVVWLLFLKKCPFSSLFFLARIMKARKTMKNQALIQEVITQLSPKFTPRIPDIKKVEYKLGVLGSTDSYHINLFLSLQAIETLMEKEYIERVHNTRDTFAYVA